MSRSEHTVWFQRAYSGNPICSPTVRVTVGVYVCIDNAYYSVWMFFFTRLKHLLYAREPVCRLVGRRLGRASGAWSSTFSVGKAQVVAVAQNTLWAMPHVTPANLQIVFRPTYPDFMASENIYIFDLNGQCVENPSANVHF